ncbi:hypothetical protein Taro_049936 [Colocasia esculenta]|uniref:Uncharacterized protein n=1 Tax=Colocasia esculenta TaxID=4460 RepID=A0A843XCE5_COLES|nr:hypothetical protein [Colocasia esculenta]
MRLKSLNAASALDAISLRVLRASFRPDRAEEDLSGTGEDAVASPAKISSDFSFRRSVRHGNHVKTTLEAWVCRRRGGFGIFQLALADFGVVYAE